MTLGQLVARHGRSLARLAGLLLFILLLVVLAEISGLRSQLTVTNLQLQLHAHPWSGVALFVLLFCVGNFVHLPGWIFLAAAVYAFGRWEGGALTYVAACTSCVSTFVIARLIGGNMVANLSSPWAQRLLAHLQAYPVRNVVLLRTVFQTLPTLNYALALTGLRLRHYLLGTLLGLPLPIAVYCLFFDSLITAAHQFAG
jgi:uncharacterized membrane protein YdjX (TVP38/TMEM64 family)